jgi:hypothetical protein
VVREVRAALEKLELASPLEAPPLDLDAMQLTIDCVGESADCLGKVAERSKARVLIAPVITRAKSGSTLRILYYDTSTKAEPLSAEHHAKGGDLDKDTFAAIPGMLKELFASSAKVETKPAVAEKTEDKADAEAEETTPAPAEATQPAPSDGKPRKRPVLGPILLGAGGVATLTAGIVVGAMMKSTQNHYADRDVQTPEQAKKADDERKLGKQQALIADVLIGVGAAAIVAGGIWFAAGLVDSPAEQPQTALLPVIGTHSAMLSLSGVWEDRP